MTFAKSIQVTSVCIANAFGDPILLTDPDRPAAPRFWSLCMISENHGTVGPAGCAFSHAPEKHERVLVVEVPTAAGAPVDQVNLKLVAGPVAAPTGQVAAPKDDLQQVIAFLMGDAELEGVSFGERHPTKAGAFWWRLNLRAAMHKAAGARAA